ncbi:MAG: hypothetical protein A2087_05615 [Spirochaetes bacterium GWD1_61_31]|nr:MAG: hypothetical protein A2Y37_03575 [Spirochaetes bacterium GWB1_60_80]OHD35113.1 MAG: hypothetical protein A2004_05360 [Spirochaetes bacterium GWC1_61_12]OHD43632.1 MAG: hypothetical protein A2087_05615 [Spirochaetes bacterium GWD1_61_31]OHD44124.1 MAG: hypothetical protein A2Y35_02040 [Spirochaetes bacterium GWE1_60_18]OHD61835.1 MAG: hypothetical protein A2Y32_13835 [Spirochaetes bacterium GWF1_60_12]HAW85101.1 hypothetical protein [Spirochaetaceae bacterium]
MIRRILVLLLIGVVLLPLCALEVTNGRLRVVINESSGHLSVFYNADTARNTWISLLYEQENKTTYPTLSFNQRTYKLGESGDFRATVSQRNAAIVIEYRSNFCIVEETITFIKSADSRVMNGLHIGFAITNSTEADASVGLRYLFDTWLGEQPNTHFRYDDGRAVSSESVVRSDSTARWLVSSGSDGTGLMLMLAGAGTEPDSVILANWKRLNDVSWAFETVGTRNFTLLPYSINDSAMAVYYNPQTLRRGGIRQLDVVLGASSSAGYALSASPTAAVAATASGADSAAASTEPTTAAVASVLTEFINGADDLQLDIDADVAAARVLLNRINELLASGQEPSAEDMALIASVLDQLEERLGSY